MTEEQIERLLTALETIAEELRRIRGILLDVSEGEDDAKMLSVKTYKDE